MNKTHIDNKGEEDQNEITSHMDEINPAFDGKTLREIHEEVDELLKKQEKQINKDLAK